MDSTAIQEILRAPPCSEQVGQVALRETHISWVILCGEFAYKIKKPLDFGFLDFSSLERRQHFCQEELRLNRRFAPELYLAVVPVTRGTSGAQLLGDGPVIDYAVKMRRFDEGQLLDNITRRGELDASLVRALGRELARLHDTLPPCRPDPASAAPGAPAALRAAIQQNFQQIGDYALAQVELRELQVIQDWSQQRYDALRPLLAQRVLDGQVIDGHGDAHLGNIALLDGAVRLFDCIEFNAALRIMDSMSEIAFLSMDLDARGFPRESRQLLTDYLEYSGDYAGLALLDLFRCYFAVVRAKVHLLREPAQHHAITSTDAYREFQRYVHLARQYTQQPQRFLAITHGVSGSGKSTIAARLVAHGGAVRIRSDVERKRLAGLSPEQRSRPEDEASLYSTAMSRRTFTRLQQLAQLASDAGFAVIVDATFLQRSSRDDFRHLARELSVPFIIIDCTAPPAQLRARLLERERQGQDASEADVAVMQRQLGMDQPLSPDELACRLPADSSEDATLLWQRLQQHCLG